MANAGFTVHERISSHWACFKPLTCDLCAHPSWPRFGPCGPLRFNAPVRLLSRRDCDKPPLFRTQTRLRSFSSQLRSRPCGFCVRKTFWRNFALLLLLCSSGLAHGPQPWTWEKVVQRFEACNPNLLAGKKNIHEPKTSAITAHLRPNLGLTLAGDVSQIDLGRLELQPVQYESDLQSAMIALKTLKIQLLTLLGEGTPVDQFDLFGLCDFTQQLPALDDVRKLALDIRPGLKAAMEAVGKAKTDHKLAIADGSTDPTVGVDAGRNPPIDLYFGVWVNLPLRVFDRTPGEKRRTELAVDRNQRLLEASELQVFSDVDSAYTAVDDPLALPRPYRANTCNKRSESETPSPSQHGGASLLDFLMLRMTTVVLSGAT